MNNDLLANYNKLPPRTRQLVEMALARPDLPLTDVANLIGMAVSTMRTRMRRAYRDLGCFGRVGLHASLAPLLQGLAQAKA